MHLHLTACSDIEHTKGRSKFLSFFRLKVNVTSTDVRCPNSVRAASQNGTQN